MDHEFWALIIYGGLVLVFGVGSILYVLHKQKKKYLKLKKENEEYVQKKAEQQQVEIKRMQELQKTD